MNQWYCNNKHNIKWVGLVLRSTLPDTRSIGPNAAMGSPIFIYRRNLLSWFEVE